MNSVLKHRPPVLASDQMAYVLRELKSLAGIRVDSPGGVIGGHILDRMNRLGLDDLEGYFHEVDTGIGGRAEKIALSDLLTVKETRFFRQRQTYTCVADYMNTWSASAKSGSEFMFWSAGCSTGQELYSLAMVVDHALSTAKTGVAWYGLGTDLSYRALSIARQGIYDGREASHIPSELSELYTELKLGDRIRVSEQIIRNTEFKHSNLLYVDSVPSTNIDVVCCQNVLIYFEKEQRHWICNQLLSRVKKGGLLILGAGEDAHWSNPQAKKIRWPGVGAYVRTGG